MMRIRRGASLCWLPEFEADVMGVGYLVEVRWLLYIFNFGVRLWSEDVSCEPRGCGRRSWVTVDGLRACDDPGIRVSKFP
ncbi:hypothetical protein Droror1_Dr00019798, partial [Drosera rotundifolia]